MIDPTNIVKYACRSAVVALVLALVWSHYRIDELEAEIQEKEQEATNARLKAEGEYNEKLSQATNDMVEQLRSLTVLAGERGADLERLRGANARLQARLKANSTEPNAEALARCSKLLEEGAGLVSEGERLLRRNAAEHDALVKLQ